MFQNEPSRTQVQFSSVKKTRSYNIQDTFLLDFNAHVCSQKQAKFLAGSCWRLRLFYQIFYLLNCKYTNPEPVTITDKINRIIDNELDSSSESPTATLASFFLNSKGSALPIHKWPNCSIASSECPTSYILSANLLSSLNQTHLESCGSICATAFQ